MEILAIIPARGGSKGIKKKNMALLNGQPLLKYTFDAAKKSRFINKIILSTDDDDFAAYGAENGIEVCMRPSELAGDKKMARAVGNALHKNPDPDNIPCFRVVNAKGELAGEFAFGGQGAQAKLLKAEGITVSDGKVDLNLFQWKVTDK